MGTGLIKYIPYAQKKERQAAWCKKSRLKHQDRYRIERQEAKARPDVMIEALKKILLVPQPTRKTKCMY